MSGLLETRGTDFCGGDSIENAFVVVGDAGLCGGVAGVTATGV